VHPRKPSDRRGDRGGAGAELPAGVGVAFDQCIAEWAAAEREAERVVAVHGVRHEAEAVLVQHVDRRLVL
jgi:ferredoxin-NADP reductase